MGLHGYDDIAYSRLAATMSNGDFEISDDPDTYRWGVVVPTAISYSLFGIDDQSASIPPILVSIATLWLLLMLCFKQPPAVAIIAMSVYCLSPSTIFYSDKTMPDVYVTFSVFGAVAVLYYYKFISVLKPALVSGALFSAMLFIGFVTKVTVLLLLPAFTVLFLVDMLQRRDVKFWFSSVVMSLLMVIAYFFYVKYETGAYFTRFDAIRMSSFFTVHGFEHKTNLDMVVRLTYGLFDLFIQRSMLIGLLFSIPVIFSLRKANLIKLQEDTFIAIVLVLVFLSAFFMSTSPDQYIPMPMNARYFSFLIPIAAIVGAPIIFEFLMYKKRLAWVLSGALILALVSVLNDYKSWQFVYIPLLTLVSLRALFTVNNKSIRGYVFLGMFVSILFIQPLEIMSYGRSSGYEKQKKLIKEYFNKDTGSNVVITNTVQSNLGEYYMGFDPFSSTKFISYGEADTFNFKESQHIYLLLNGFSRELSGLSVVGLPPYCRMPAEMFRQLFSEGRIELYAIDRPQLLKQINEYPVRIEFNDFEQENAGWSVAQDDIQLGLGYSGSRANRVKAGGYSATFSNQLMNIGLKEGDKSFVKSSVMIYSQDFHGLLLVIEIREEGLPTFWQAEKKEKFDQFKDGWLKIKIKSEIPDHFGLNAKLGVYVWNTGDNEGFIDDFRIEIAKLGISKTSL
ncbi:MAG: hypothetical protein COB85_00350 [Bacteroidetes bacterium]|nr:MAG: hypothetical protein COB85_00350 [Bacteroidota bacterium]